MTASVSSPGKVEKTCPDNPDFTQSAQDLYSAYRLGIGKNVKTVCTSPPDVKTAIGPYYIGDVGPFRVESIFWNNGGSTAYHLCLGIDTFVVIGFDQTAL